MSEVTGRVGPVPVEYKDRVSSAEVRQRVINRGGGGDYPRKAKEVHEAAQQKQKEKGDSPSAAVSSDTLTKEINHPLSRSNSLRFSMDQELKQVVVSVVDKDTDSVIRQIPDEQMLDLAKQMRDLEGVLLNTRV
ncbi:MAG: flagellar protein FlaG [Magnetococcales bacterium]|nr:flagellar protein FlaG [Magnetococcales bacterium]